MLHSPGLARMSLPPYDFEEMFVQLGWEGIQRHYGKHSSVIRRWMRMCAPNLKDRRAAYVQRGKQPMLTIVSKPEPIECSIDPELLRAAAHHLRIPRNGGWVVFVGPQGDWRVGSRSMTGEQLLAMARNKGFIHG